MERPWISSEKLLLFQYERELFPLSGWGATTIAGAGGAGSTGAGAIDGAGTGDAGGAGAVDGAGADGVWGARPGITSFSGWVWISSGAGSDAGGGTTAFTTPKMVSLIRVVK